MRVEDRTTGIKCAQCGSTTPEKGFTTRKVIHRKFDHQTKKQYVGETLFTVCNNDNECGENLQMAHEG